jgi:hypothetical protein
MSGYEDDHPFVWPQDYQPEPDETVPSILTNGELETARDKSFCNRKTYLSSKESVFVLSFTTLLFIVCLAMILLLLLFVPFQQ